MTMTSDERDKHAAYAGFWVSIAMVIFGSGNNFVAGNYTQGGAGFALIAALFCFRIGLRRAVEYHEARMSVLNAKNQEMLAELRISEANALMAEMTQDQMQKHIEAGGAIGFTSNIPTGPRRPTH